MLGLSRIVESRLLTTGARASCQAIARMKVWPAAVEDSQFRQGLLIQNYGIKVLAAAHSVLTRASDGSSPSGPNFDMHWSFSGKNSALVMRQRGFESHPVLFHARQRWVPNRKVVSALGIDL